MIGEEGRALVRDFADEMDSRRRELGLSWEELSRTSGVSRTYLRDLAGQRRGQGLPSVDVVAKIARALEVEPDYFRVTRARAVLRSRKAIDAVYARLTAPTKQPAAT